MARNRPPAPETADHKRTRAIDVAAIAGVSESAVSRTFRDGSVSAHVRQRVLAAARELGYRPNAMAQALLTRRSNVIAILMTTNTNSHFPEVLSELSHAADAHRQRVMLFTVDDPALVSDVVDQILSYQVDGVLSLTAISAADARILEQQSVALVLYNSPRADYPVSLVSCDHRAAGRMLGEHLLGLGHRAFGMIEGPQRSTLANDRAEGIYDALTAHGIPRKDVVTAIGDFGYERGRAGAAEVLTAKRPVTALVCINDITAIGAIDEATSRGLHVPDDLSVASFDGVPAGTWDRYRLTTMRQPLPQLANAAFETIMRKIETPRIAFETRLISCELEAGGSAKAVAPD
ncbi:LacI family DNA-binding transcriptional regulator [Glacieibacterium frigidum]|uniref:LacI family transcriptional regulator n=1 Tax=Glacieibacterium frigidum TaxID=2593303 RepID=A0A552UHP5_9SPHN|nr:LacI family DNA-binding transcriptional regulator [Glacieibacterium frigidum]TRW17743.1 LacI family transcriptional regulator [Glacieibacterium frigidum]